MDYLAEWGKGLVHNNGGLLLSEFTRECGRNAD